MKEFPDKDWKEVDLISDLPRKPFGWFKPPWSRYGHPYNGRIEWWADYRYKDYVLRTGRWRYSLWPVVEEYDPFYYDPPVPDGESQIGFGGRDETYDVPQFVSRRFGEKTGPEAKWTEYILKNSTHYKDIAAKYKISDEHPGLTIQPFVGMADFETMRAVPGLANNWYAWYQSWQPRFYNAPLNQDCLGKSLFGLKVGAIASFIMATQTTYWWDRIRTVSPTNIYRRFVQFAPTTIPVSIAFCGSVCLSAQYRDKDDMWNWVIASWAAGLTQATMLGRMNVMPKVAVPVMIASCAWLVFKTSQQGPAMLWPHNENPFSGPVGWMNPLFPEDNKQHQLENIAIIHDSPSLK